MSNEDKFAYSPNDGSANWEHRNYRDTGKYESERQLVRRHLTKAGIKDKARVGAVGKSTVVEPHKDEDNDRVGEILKSHPKLEVVRRVEATARGQYLQVPGWNVRRKTKMAE